MRWAPKGFSVCVCPRNTGGGGLGDGYVVQETALVGCPLQGMLFSSGVTGAILSHSAPRGVEVPLAAGRGYR